MNSQQLRSLVPVFMICLGSALIAGDPAEATRKVKQGRSLLFEQKYTEAQKKFEEVLADNADHLEALMGKIDALAGQRKLSQAGAIAKKKAGDAGAAGLILSANNKIWTRDFKGAEVDLKRALTRPGADYMAHFLLGYVRYRSRDLDGAIEHLTAAIEANEDFPESYYLLGDIYLKKSDSENMFKYWRPYLEKIPHAGSRYQYVVSTLQKLGGH